MRRRRRSLFYVILLLCAIVLLHSFPSTLGSRAEARRAAAISYTDSELVKSWKKVNNYDQKYDLSPPKGIYEIVSTTPYYEKLDPASQALVRKHLKAKGWEPHTLHEFRSPYVITPLLSPEITGLNYSKLGYRFVENVFVHVSFCYVLLVFIGPFWGYL